MRNPACLALTLSAALLAGAVDSAPVPNLVLACPDASAIGQPGLDSCGGYTYEIPTNQRIVSTGSFSLNFWVTASDLGGPNTLLVCTLPVEPGTYSSCRDALGVRRTAYVPKDSVLAGGVVTVSKTGGDYADPITAAENAYAGDTWCVAPVWPVQPCVMQISEGVFILPETLVIPEYIAVVGAGKGATMLIADNGVGVAVSTRGSDAVVGVSTAGNIRITDLTIVNSQPGAAQSVGVVAHGFFWAPLPTVELHDVAIHVSGATENIAVSRRDSSLDILDSDLTAVGSDSTAVSSLGVENVGERSLTIERSHVSAETALTEPYTGTSPGDVRFIDSEVLGAIVFNPEASLLEISGGNVVGDVTAINDHVSVVITGTSIKGNVNANAAFSGADFVAITETHVEGNVAAGWDIGPIIFDTVSVHGHVLFEESEPSVRGSYIVSSDPTEPALALREAGVQLEQSFVQGAVEFVDSNSRGGLTATSSVLAGPVLVPATCSDTYGADYELLDAECQPQGP
jgi:hypothetical protein